MFFKLTMIWIVSVIFLMISVISQAKSDTPPYGSKRQIHKSPFPRNRFDTHGRYVNVTKPIVYRLDGQYFECTTVSDVSAVDGGDFRGKSFTEVRSTAKLPASENRRPPEIRARNATGRLLESVGPAGSRAYDGMSGVGRDGKRENGPEIGEEPSAVDPDEYDSNNAADAYTVSRRESDESNGTYAEDSNEHRDGLAVDKSHGIERPANDKNDTTDDDAMLAAVQRDRGNDDRRDGSKSDEQDDCGGYKPKDGSPTVWVNNNIRFKFVLSAGGRLLNGSSSPGTDNKTSPVVTLKVEKFTGLDKTVNTL